MAMSANCNSTIGRLQALLDSACTLMTVQAERDHTPTASSTFTCILQDLGRRSKKLSQIPSLPLRALQADQESFPFTGACLQAGGSCRLAIGQAIKGSMAGRSIYLPEAVPTTSLTSLDSL